METKTLKIKDFKVDVAQNGTEGHFTGYLSVFNVRDEYNDVIKKGAFRKTLKENNGKIWLLDCHNSSERLGYLKLAEDDYGLKVVDGVLNLNKMQGRDVYEELKFYSEAGLALGLSIGYMTIKYTIEKAEDNVEQRVIQEVHLYEGSIVTFPANTYARVNEVKQSVSITKEEIKQMIQEELKSLSQSAAVKADIKRYFEFLKH